MGKQTKNTKIKSGQFLKKLPYKQKTFLRVSSNPKFTKTLYNLLGQHEMRTILKPEIDSFDILKLMTEAAASALDEKGL